MSKELASQVVVVTGGGRGIGAAIAQRLASMSATTVICGRNVERLNKTAKEIIARGGRCEALVCDLADWKSVEAFAKKVLESLGRLDILVNNAGIGGFVDPLHKLPPEDWDAIMNTNLRGVYYRVRAFTPAMIERKAGHILNISSIASK